MPEAAPGVDYEPTNPRALLDAIFYVVRGGCAWRLLPHDFPIAAKRPTIILEPGA